MAIQCIDATGLQVYGTGEHHAQKPGGGHRRSWRKLPLGVDEQIQTIVADEMTGSHVHDSRVMPQLLTQIPGKSVWSPGMGPTTPRPSMNPLAGAGQKSRFPNSEPRSQ
jgi:hypothetical protein